MAHPARYDVMIVMGTRPEAIKLCPLVAALSECATLHPVVVSTGQHGAMLDEVLRLFDVRPDEELAIHRPGQSLTDVTVRALDGLGGAIEHIRPAALVVQGDTTTTLAGALSGFYHKVPVVHLEAGLRTDNRQEPFPEEMNRRLVTQIADLHLAATPGNKQRLLSDGVPERHIAVVGNTVIDALYQAVTWRRPWSSPKLSVLDGPVEQLVLVTAHRRESWGQPLRDVASAIASVAQSRPNTVFVWPLHANPIVQRSVRPVLRCSPNVVLTDALGYADLTAVLARASLVLTDSGGVQEEAPALGKPVLVLRNVTERTEAIEAGVAKLIGTDPDVVCRELAAALADERTSVRWSPYGDGKAARRSAAAIAALLGVGTRADEFDPNMPPLSLRTTGGGLTSKCLSGP